MLKYLIMLITVLVLFAGAYYFLSPFLKNSEVEKQTVTEVKSEPATDSSQVQGDSLELDLTALDRDLDEVDTMETEYNLEVNKL